MRPAALLAPILAVSIAFQIICKFELSPRPSRFARPANKLGGPSIRASCRQIKMMRLSSRASTIQIRIIRDGLSDALENEEFNLRMDA
jgi:hypothetical protein